jgi:hypothetical protein
METAPVARAIGAVPFVRTCFDGAGDRPPPERPDGRRRLGVTSFVPTGVRDRAAKTVTQRHGAWLHFTLSDGHPSMWAEMGLRRLACRCDTGSRRPHSGMLIRAEVLVHGCGDLWKGDGSSPFGTAPPRSSKRDHRCTDGNAGLIFGASGLKKYRRPTIVCMADRSDRCTLRPWLNG